MQGSPKQKIFLIFFYFFAFLNSILNFDHFPKKMTLRADVSVELAAPKNMIR